MVTDVLSFVLRNSPLIAWNNHVTFRFADKRLGDDEKIQPQNSKSVKLLDKRGNKFVYKRLDAHFVWPQCMLNGE